MPGPNSAFHVASFPPPGAQLPAGSAPARYIQNFPFAQSQRRLNWCWAAVLSSISSVIPPPGAAAMSQEDVVRAVQGESGLNSDTMEDLLLAVSGVGWNFTPLIDTELANPDFDGQFRTPINDGRPVAIAIQWDNGVGHAICAFGHGTLGGEPALIIYDPSAIDGEGDNLTMVTLTGMTRYEARLASGSRFGRWVQACILER
jgi:hypothetical protein